MAGDDEVNLVVEAIDDVDDRAGDTRAPVDVVSVAGGRLPPSWMRTTIASTPRRFSSGTSAFTVSASSRNGRPATPDGLTMVGVPSSVMPMKATLAPLKF